MTINRREILAGAAAIAAAATLPELEEEPEHLGDFLGDCEGITLFSVLTACCGELVF
jgi:hypothetical protein